MRPSEPIRLCAAEEQASVLSLIASLRASAEFQDACPASATAMLRRLR